MKCGQSTCETEATMHMLWPGRGPQPICDICSAKAAGVAEHMGFPVSFVALGATVITAGIVRENAK